VAGIDEATRSCRAGYACPLFGQTLTNAFVPIFIITHAHGLSQQNRPEVEFVTFLPMFWAKATFFWAAVSATPRCAGL